MTTDVFNTFMNLKDLVPAHKIYEESSQYKAETLESVQSTLKMGLAICVSKNSKWLNNKQRDSAIEWLNEQISEYGGDETVSQLMNSYK